jgi:hypothetical protein
MVGMNPTGPGRRRRAVRSSGRVVTIFINAPKFLLDFCLNIIKLINDNQIYSKKGEYKCLL